MAEFTRNFALADVKSITLSVSSVSSSIELPNNSAEDIMLINLSTRPIYVRTGLSAIEADLKAMVIVEGEKGVYSRGLKLFTATHLAAIVENGLADLIIIQGQGS